MTAPSNIRVTSGFRSLSLFELNASYYPIGTLTLQRQTPYIASGGSTISGSGTVAIAAGATVSGSVGYYGIQHSGAKVLTINDPTPRVIPHIGDDGIISLQVLPATEPASGEVRVAKTNDKVDSIAANVKKFTVGEMNLLGSITSQRGFENQVGALAYSFGQDTDPDSSSFGATVWDFRIFPKVTVFQRDTGYGQEANERLYSFTPAYVTAHMWGTAFTIATEGFTKAQIIRGISQYKPMIVTFLGDGTTAAFPFDSAVPAQATGKVATWVNGTLQASGATYQASVRGLHFSAAPALNAVVFCLYETV
jgi:hypothetical protein